MKFCSNCGTENKNGEKFCSNCGASLKLEAKPEVKEKTVKSETPTEVTETVVKEKTVKTGGFDYLRYLLFATIKPSKNYDKYSEKLSTPKNALIIAGIIIVAMMVLNLIFTVIQAATTEVFDLDTFEYVNGASQLNYVSLIFLNLFIYAAVVFAVPGVYYLGMLILKKSANYMKMLAITATSMIPYTVLGLVLSKLFGCFNGMFWVHLSIILALLGSLYTLIIFIVNMKKELVFEEGEEDKEVFFHTICGAIILTVAYIAIYSAISSAVTNELGGMLGL